MPAKIVQDFVIQKELCGAGMAKPLADVQRGAIFDATGNYRYTLWRSWRKQGKRVAFIMLNPSTADALKDDPTIRRCMAFAQVWGYASVEVVNLFAYRTPHPSNLKEVDDPIGTDNDAYLLQASQRSHTLIYAWGNWGSLLERDRQVQDLLQGLDIGCLGVNRNGQPRHPLYLPRTTRIISFPHSVKSF
jgi:hypothetical protein